MRAGLSYASGPGRWVLLVTVLGSAMASIDATVVGLARPAIGRDFGASLTTPADYHAVAQVFFCAPGRSGRPYRRLRHAVPCFPSTSEVWLRLLEAYRSLQPEPATATMSGRPRHPLSGDVSGAHLRLDELVVYRAARADAVPARSCRPTRRAPAVSAMRRPGIPAGPGTVRRFPSPPLPAPKPDQMMRQERRSRDRRTGRRQWTASAFA